MDTLLNNRLGKATLITSLVVMIYWLIANVYNVYTIAAVGAVYEMLWLFMLVLLVAVPVFSFVQWAKQKFNVRSVYFVSLLISLITIAVLQLFFV